jgi:hypothetical protein
MDSAATPVLAKLAAETEATAPGRIVRFNITPFEPTTNPASALAKKRPRKSVITPLGSGAHVLPPLMVAKITPLAAVTFTLPVPPPDENVWLKGESA